MPLVVAVVGDALLDVTLEPAEPMRPGGDVPADRPRRSRRPGGERRRASRSPRSRRAARMRARRRRRGAAASRGAATPRACAVDAELLAGHRGGGRPPRAGGRAEHAEPAGRRSSPSLDLPRLADGAEWLVISGYALLEDGAIGFAGRCAALPVRRAVLGCALPDGRLDDWRAAATAARADLVILNADEARELAPTAVTTSRRWPARWRPTSVRSSSSPARGERRRPATACGSRSSPRSAAAGTVDTTGAGRRLRRLGHRRAR